LFVVDLGTRETRRLTHDTFAALEPAWSPDGTTIAYVTDRFTTDPVNLEFGDYRIAFLDPATGEIRPAPGFAEGKNINPQWTPDGRGLYFLSDHDGVSNLYRMEVAGGRLTQITDLPTGV